MGNAQRVVIIPEENLMRLEVPLFDESSMIEEPAPLIQSIEIISLEAFEQDSHRKMLGEIIDKVHEVSGVPVMFLGDFNDKYK